MNESKVRRRRSEDPEGTAYDTRNTRPWWISYEDCIHDEVFDFPISVDRPSDTLEIWAGTGTDCSMTRDDEDHQQCWILAAVPPTEDSFTVSVPVRNIVRGKVGNGGDVPDNVEDEVCSPTTADSDGTEVNLFFWIQDGGQVVGTKDTWDAKATGGIGFDLVGPSPPGSISIGMGESQLTIDVSEYGEDTDRERFSAYCEPLAEGETCEMADMVRGGRAPLELACGEASETSGTIRTKKTLANGTKIENGTTYAVAVAGEDIIGNAGVLSEVACATPLPLDDFYEIYTRDGGPGGGGFCNLRPGATTRAPAGTMLMVGAALAGLIIRRRSTRA